MDKFWDERYSADEYVYGEAPNDFFKSVIDKLEPGKALLPADGEGRNSVYAAMLGWQTHAFDYSRVARKKALALAKKHDVSIFFDAIAAEDFDCDDNKFGLIALTFAHFEPGLREKFHKMLPACLKQGGLLIMECFSKEQINRDTGGPKNIDMLYSEEILRNDFAELNIRLLEKKERVIKEGPYHDGPGFVLQLIAEKNEIAYSI